MYFIFYYQQQYFLMVFIFIQIVNAFGTVATQFYMYSMDMVSNSIFPITFPFIKTGIKMLLFQTILCFNLYKMIMTCFKNIWINQMMLNE
jgi:hypothetical protein